MMEFHAEVFSMRDFSELYFSGHIIFLSRVNSSFSLGKLFILGGNMILHLTHAVEKVLTEEKLHRHFPR